MPLDIRQLLRANQGRNYELHRQHVNPQFARALRTIGFDRCYVRGEGQYLWDIEGHRYLDMLGGYAVFNLGRNHPDIRQALTEFLEVDHANLVQMDAPLLSGLLAEELKKRVPDNWGLDIVYFTNTGAEGVETAIKFARCATGRPAIVHCHRSFHGLTNGALSINGCESFRPPAEPSSPAGRSSAVGSFDPLLPGCRAIPFDDLAALEAALAVGDVAAFITEPIQGKGVFIPSASYLAEASALCRRHGALFIVDEVQTGFGRTGKFLATEHDPAAEPDMVILSKALSGGYVPVGAVMTRQAVYDTVFSSMDRAVIHSSTFGQNALAMVAGLATLKAMDEHDVMSNAERMGRLIRDGLEKMRPRFELLREVRQRGLMIGIQFGRPRSMRLRAAWSLIHRMDGNLFPQAIAMPLLDDHRVMAQVAGHDTDCVKLIPPLIINEDDVRWFLTAFEKVCEDLHQFPGPLWGVLKKLGALAVTRRPREAVGLDRSEH